MKSAGSAIIGAGFIGPVHLEALRRLGRPVVGVLGSSATASQAAAARWDIPRGYADLDELLTDHTASVVHVTSPNRDHASQCEALLRAGKHVICEKPLAMTSEESARLVRRATQVPFVTALCHNIRYYPLCWEMRERIANGELGTIFHVTGSYVQDWLLYDTDFNWRVETQAAGTTRAVADIGTHWLDLVQWIIGSPVTSVCADLRTVHSVRKAPQGSVQTFQGASAPLATRDVPIQTEDYGSVLLQFDREARGAFTVSQVTAGRKNRLCVEIAGSRGACAWDSEKPNTLWLGHRERPSELLLRDPALLSPAARAVTSYPGGHNEGFADTFKQLFRAVYDAIDGTSTERSFPTFAEGHHEVTLCEAILKSHRARTWIDVG